MTAGDSANTAATSETRSSGIPCDATNTRFFTTGVRYESVMYFDWSLCFSLSQIVLHEHHHFSVQNTCRIRNFALSAQTRQYSAVTAASCCPLIFSASIRWRNCVVLLRLNLIRVPLYKLPVKKVLFQHK